MGPRPFECLWYIFISLSAAIMTVWDKAAAVRGKRRLSERALLTVGLLGGAAAMLLTMRLIRHKTLHKKFMIGLPFAIILHLLIIFLLLLYTPAPL